jgi:hypothetical protein
MWGLVISVATIASSLITGSKSVGGGGGGAKQGSSATSDSSWSRYHHQLVAAFGSLYAVNNRQFLSGVGTLSNLEES